MEKIIVVEPLQKRFTVSVKNANKEARNRSYSNASDCCGAKLKQDKKCSSCGEIVYATECKRKIVKIGKEEHLIDASALKQVQESLSNVEELSLHTFLKELPKGSEDRFDSLMYAVPVEKKEAQYKELQEILKDRIAIGKGVFGTNEYQVVVSVGEDDVLRIRKLVEESQRYDFEPEEALAALVNVKLSEDVVQIENKILDKKSVDSFDLTEFRDMRSEYEERVIEDFVLNGRVPEVKKEVEQQQTQSELERLKQLMGE